MPFHFIGTWVIGGWDIVSTVLYGVNQNAGREDSENRQLRVLLLNVSIHHSSYFATCVAASGFR